MDEKTVALIEALAEKFGVTAEHLWGALLRQAPISGVVDLVVSVLLIASAVTLALIVKSKTANQAKLDMIDFMGAWTITAMLVIPATLVALSLVENVVAAFFNPEYWAMSKIMGL